MYDSIPRAQKMTIRERFWSKVEKTETCWIWKGSKISAGYGMFHFRGQNRRAHRFSYEMTYGPIPDGLSVLHKCDVPLCVRPDHLFLGTQEDNMQDMSKKGRSLVGEKSPIAQHPEVCRRGETHYRAKLTKEKVLQIRELSAAHSTPELADMFGVNGGTIHDILSRRTWKHI
jgi:hypothetical protein